MKIVVMQSTIDNIAKNAPHKLAQIESIGQPIIKYTKDKVQYYEFKQFKN